MADRTNRKGTLERLFNLFNLGYDKSANDIKPTSRFNLKSGETVTHFEDFPSHVQKFLNYWNTQCHDTAQNFENRKLLWSDCDMMYYQSPLLSRAMDLFADEVVQADSNFRIIDIEAEPKLKEFISKFFDDVGIDDLLRPTAFSIVKYGNAGWAISTDDKGVNEIIPIEILDFKDRFEFNAHQIREQMGDPTSNLYRMTNSQKMKMLVDSILKKEEFASYLKSYLFGFQIGDIMLPPWKFLHFRNYVNESPFKPFGMPFFIHAISAYRQYDSALTLQVAARAASFPIYVYELDFPNTADITMKIEKAIEFMNELDNSGLHATRKEELGIMERMVTLKGLYEFKQEQPEINLSRIDDIEMMRDDLILSTGMPRSFLDPNSTGFGNSGVALIQQFKPFARKVYMVQSIILEQISQLVKIHCILSGQFKEEELEFQLTMPYPESQTDRELIGSQTDLLNLANSVLDSIGQRIVGDPNAILPPELIKNVYSQILPYDTDRIDDWVKSALITKQEKASEEPPEEEGGPAGAGLGAPGGGGGGGGGDGGFGAPGEAGAEVPEEGEGEDFGPPPGEEGAGEETGEPAETPAATAPETPAPATESYTREVRKTRKLLEKIGNRALRESIRRAIFEAKQNVWREGLHGKRHFVSSRKKMTEVRSDFPAEKLWDFKIKKVEILKEQYEEELAREEHTRKEASLFNKEILAYPRDIDKEERLKMLLEEIDVASLDEKPHDILDDYFPSKQ